jgi:hypothetical protein
MVISVSTSNPTSTMQLHVIWRDTTGAIGEWPIEDMTVSEMAILIDDVEEVDPDDPTHHSGTYEWTYTYRQRHPHNKYFN